MHGCFCPATKELSSCVRNNDLQAKNITMWLFKVKFADP